MTRRAPSNFDLVEDLTANIAHAAWIESHIDDWRGVGAGIGLGVQQDTSFPTEAAALALLDGGNDTSILIEQAQAQLDDLARLRVIANRMNARREGTLQVLDRERAKQRVADRTTPTTQGFCEACDRSCDGSSEYDSLIAGLCGKCRKAFDRWREHNGTSDRAGDRVTFVTLERRKRNEKRHVPHAS